MTVAEILEQAKALSLQERKELTKLLVDTLDVETVVASEEHSKEHWGQSLKRLMDEVGTIELLYPEIEDPVEWVKHLRSVERKRRLGEWSDGE
jgi:hypothetical protein